MPNGTRRSARRITVTAILLLVWLLLPGVALPAAPPVMPVQAEDAALDGTAVRLEGQVNDAQGAPAPEARVMASGRQAHREASSGPDGAFVIESLPPGVYTVQAISSGASSPPTRVTIDAGVPPPPLLLVLEAAQKVEEIAVTASRRSPGRG